MTKNKAPKVKEAKTTPIDYAMVTSAIDIIHDWVDLENPKHPWHGTKKYFEEYEQRWNRAARFMAALKGEKWL
jgi:hypothetical protein